MPSRNLLTAVADDALLLASARQGLLQSCSLCAEANGHRLKLFACTARQSSRLSQTVPSTPLSPVFDRLLDQAKP